MAVFVASCCRRKLSGSLHRKNTKLSCKIATTCYSSKMLIVNETLICMQMSAFH